MSGTCLKIYEQRERGLAGADLFENLLSLDGQYMRVLYYALVTLFSYFSQKFS